MLRFKNKVLGCLPASLFPHRTWHVDIAGKEAAGGGDDAIAGGGCAHLLFSIKRLIEF